MRHLCLSVCVGLVLGCNGAIEGSSIDDPVLADAGSGTLDAATNGSVDADHEAGDASLDGARADRDATGADAGSTGGAGSDAAVSDAGGDAGSRDGGSPEAGANQGTPVFVVAGYEGGRVSSRDLGLTWSDAQKLGPYGDNEFVLSGVTYGKGVFVAAGWKVLTSSDGESWTERQHPESEWFGSVNFGLNMFVAAGGSGYTAYSSDGINWQRGSGLDGEASDTSAFGNGVFMAATRDGNWWRSTDGKVWNADSDGHNPDRIFWCVDRFAETCSSTVPAHKTAFGQGVYIRIENEQIRRSTNGTTWSDGVDPGFAATSVGFGYAP